MASSIAAARAALFDSLVAADGTNGIQVTFGPPSAYEEKRVIAMLGVGPTDEESAALGADRAEERYRIRVACKSHDEAGDAQSVDEDCFAMADVVRAVVKANRELSGTVRWAKVVAQESDGAQPAQGGGWVCFNTVSIECSQRVT